MITIAVIGAVDSGKSTFVGRLVKIFNPNLYKNIIKGKEFTITDNLSTEIINNKTIKASTFYLNDNIRLINCPGHLEFKIDTISSIIEADVVINIIKSDSSSKYDKEVCYFNNILPFISKNIININNKRNNFEYTGHYESFNFITCPDSNILEILNRAINIHENIEFNKPNEKSVCILLSEDYKDIVSKLYKKYKVTENIVYKDILYLNKRFITNNNVEPIFHNKKIIGVIID